MSSKCYLRLEKIALESCVFNGVCGHLYVIVTVPQVKFCHELLAADLSSEIVNVRDRAAVSDSNSIEVPVVDAQTKASVRLFNEENLRGKFGC